MTDTQVRTGRNGTAVTPAVQVPTTGRPKPEAGRSATAWRKTWTFPFKMLRELYWVLYRDSKIRSQGLQTIGRVVGTRSEEHHDPESGTFYTHYVRYEYRIGGGRHTAEKKVGDLGDLKKGVPIRVYYLPDTSPPDSALDRGPRALG